MVHSSAAAKYQGLLPSNMPPSASKFKCQGLCGFCIFFHGDASGKLGPCHSMRFLQVVPRHGAPIDPVQMAPTIMYLHVTCIAVSGRCTYFAPGINSYTWRAAWCVAMLHCFSHCPSWLAFPQPPDCASTTNISTCKEQNQWPNAISVDNPLMLNGKLSELVCSKATNSLYMQNDTAAHVDAGHSCT